MSRAVSAVCEVSSERVGREWDNLPRRPIGTADTHERIAAIKEVEAGATSREFARKTV